MFPIGQKSCKLEPVSRLTPKTKGGGTRRKCWATGPSGLFPQGQKSCKLEPVSLLTPNTEVGRRGTRLARLRPEAPEVLARPSFNFTCKLLSSYGVGAGGGGRWKGGQEGRGGEGPVTASNCQHPPALAGTGHSRATVGPPAIHRDPRPLTASNRQQPPARQGPGPAPPPSRPPALKKLFS